MSSACETGAGMVYKSPLISSRTKVPVCFATECKTPVMLEPGHCYENQSPITMVDPAAMDNLYRPWAPGDGFEHGAVLTCSRNTKDWEEPCEVYAVKDPGDCNGIPMEAIFNGTGATEADLVKVRATSGCCWKWRSLPRPNTKTPCSTYKAGV